MYVIGMYVLECIHHFRDDWLGYSEERFRSGNEEYSSFQRRLVTLENVFWFKSQIKDKRKIISKAW